MEANRLFLATLSRDGDLYLLYQSEEAKHLKIERDCAFTKVATTEAHVVVVGWNEESKTASFLLYDSSLKFRDEVSVKLSRHR